MSSVAIIRSQVERRIPGALTIYERSDARSLSDRNRGHGSGNWRHSQRCTDADMRSGRNYFWQDISAPVYCWRK